MPRGPVGKLGGKILGCRGLVVLHDGQGPLAYRKLGISDEQGQALIKELL